MKDVDLHLHKREGHTASDSFRVAGFHPTPGNDRQAEGAVGRERVRARSRALKGVRVLLVDDDPDAREVASLMLQQFEADVKAVGSAGEALAIIADMTGWRPDVLVSDIEMPGIDGCSLMRSIRALESELGLWLPAVAMTAHSRPEDRAAVLAAGFQVHVAKPVEPAVLRSVVASLAKHV